MITKEQDRNLRDVAEELFGYSPCMHCRNFNQEEVSSRCKAFTESDIPKEIFFGKNLHKDPFPGDHGIRFESSD